MTSPRHPTPAERARTLASGVVSGVLHLPAGANPAGHRVQHLADPAGAMALLICDDAPVRRELDALLDEADGVEPPLLLDVLDLPPGRLTLPRVRLCVSGWVRSVPLASQRALGGRLAAARPIGALLEIGHGCTLYRFEIAEIHVTTRDGTVRVSPEEFAAAAPDPLYESEEQLARHLETHHADAAIGYAITHLPPEAAAAVTGVNVAGVDRYGVELLCSVRGAFHVVRAGFHDPVTDEDSLSRELHRLLCTIRCANRSVR